MKRNMIKRIFLGIPIGIAISFLIPLAISASIGDGNFYPCVPQLVQSLGSELNAVALQTLLNALYGGICGGASVIFDREDWSLVNQSGLFFLIIAGVFMPMAWLLRWMEHNLLGAAIYFGEFIAIYLVIWAIQYLIARKRVRSFNEKLKTIR